MAWIITAQTADRGHTTHFAHHFTRRLPPRLAPPVADDPAGRLRTAEPVAAAQLPHHPCVSRRLARSCAP